MARGGGRQGGKGGKGGGRGPTQRSQNYLAQYGYPSNRALSREAARLAEGSVGSIREVNRPFQRQAQSARDFLTAVQAALGEAQGQVNAGYGQATQQQGAVDQAAQARLAALGLGSDAAGVQAVQGARGDSATANLLSNEASAKAYAAAQPGIASGNTGVVLAGLRKQQTDALAARRDQLRQSFFQALGQVQSNALARAGFNQSADQFNQNMALQQQQFGAQQAAQAASQAQAAAGLAEQKREYNVSRRDAMAAAKNPLAALGQSTGMSAHELYQQQQQMSAQIQDAQAGHFVPYDPKNPPPKGYKIRRINGALMVEVAHPAPAGALREPNQANNIVNVYKKLQLDFPGLEPLILQSMKASYPLAAWNAFLKIAFPQTGGRTQSGGGGGRHR